MVKGKAYFIFANFPLTAYSWRVNAGGANVDLDLLASHRQLSRGIHLKTK